MSTMEFWTLVIALVGALSWLPTILDFFKTCEIEGKLISRYFNFTQDKTKSFALFKLSIYSKNKPFYLKNISCEVEFENGEKILAVARNNRFTVFTFDTTYKLTVLGTEFLNNFSFLPTDENKVGYLLFQFDDNIDRKLISTNFVFESFEGKTQKIVFNEQTIHEEQLFFDDTIWQPIDKKEIENNPAFKPLLKKE